MQRQFTNAVNELCTVDALLKEFLAQEQDANINVQRVLLHLSLKRHVLPQHKLVPQSTDQIVDSLLAHSSQLLLSSVEDLRMHSLLQPYQKLVHKRLVQHESALSKAVNHVKGVLKRGVLLLQPG